MNNAEIHAKIAAEVYVGSIVQIAARAAIVYRNGERIIFDLLETDGNGEPTMQAKASAFDVLWWLNRVGFIDFSINPTSIFSAAKAIVEGG